MARHVSPAKTQAERIYALLGGKAAARLDEVTMLSLHEAAEAKLGVVTIEKLAENLDSTRNDLLRTLAVSARTLARRRDVGVLSAEESDRALRVARVLAFAEEVLGDLTEGVRWLKRPNRSLGGRVPLDLIRTDAGASMVTDVLGRLEHGVFG